MINLDFLESVDVFSDLDDDQLNVVREAGETREFRRGDQIFGAGEKAEFLWVVHEGQVDLVWGGRLLEGGEPPVTRLSRSGTFGWSSVVPPQAYKLSAFCASRRCRLLKIGAARLKRQFEADSSAGYAVMSKMLAIISQRFYQVQDEIARQRGHEIINRW
jgi:CRP-like cAMP-binding protein